MDNYPNPNRGGVIGELLQLDSPQLRNARFPFLQYVVVTNPTKPWDWGWLSHNPSITWEFVQNNPNRRWDWLALSSKKDTPL